MTEKKNDIAVCNYGEAVALLKENGNQYQVSTFGNDNENNQWSLLYKWTSLLIVTCLWPHCVLDYFTFCLVNSIILIRVACQAPWSGDPDRLSI